MGRHALLLGNTTFHADRALDALPGVRHDVAQLKHCWIQPVALTASTHMSIWIENA